MGYRPALQDRLAKKEITRQPKAKEAAVKEWKRLWEKDVWDATVVREWHDVAAEARKTCQCALGKAFRHDGGKSG